MLNTLKKLFSKKKQNSLNSTVKKRLQMTIFHDRLQMMSMPPEKLDALKEELLKVVAKYFEIDMGQSNCSLVQDEGEVAFVSNIALKSIKKYNENS